MKVEYSKETFEDKRSLVQKRIVSFSLLLDHKAEIEITNSIIASLKIKDETFKIESKSKGWISFNRNAVIKNQELETIGKITVPALQTSTYAKLILDRKEYKFKTKHYFNSSKSALVGKNDSIAIKNKSSKSSSEKLSLECNHVDDLLILVALYINEAFLFDNID